MASEYACGGMITTLSRKRSKHFGGLNDRYGLEFCRLVHLMMIMDMHAMELLVVLTLLHNGRIEDLASNCLRKSHDWQISRTQRNMVFQDGSKNLSDSK